MIIPGKNMMVYVNGDGVHGDTDKLYPIGCDKNCSLNITSELIETTVKDSGYYKSFLPSFVQWGISGDGLVDYSKVWGIQSLQDVLLNRQIVIVKLQAKLSETEAITYSGTGYLQNVVISGPAEGSEVYTYQLAGTGKLEIDNTIPVEGGGGTPTDDMAQVYRIQFTTTAGQTSYQNDDLIGATLLLMTLEDHCLYKGTDSDNMAGLNPSTGTVSWNYEAGTGMRAIIIYKK